MADTPNKEKRFVFQEWQADSSVKKRIQVPPAKVEKPAPVSAPSTPEPEASPQISLPTAEDIERMHEEARASGYEAGFAEGKIAGEKKAQELGETAAKSFGLLISNLEDALGKIDQSVAEQLLALALETAAQITRGSIAAKTDVLLPLIQEAITTLPLHHAHVVIRLNPVDAENVRHFLGEQFSQSGTQIIEDSTVSRGGCQLQAGASEIDATIETRWKRVLETIGTEPQEWLNL
jgi:flagellar assembly protein FliH